MTLNDLLLAVKEQNLTKDQLEGYRDQMASMFADMQIEMAELEKSEALFMGKRTYEQSVAGMKGEWKSTTEGLRLIVLKRYATALKTLLSSLKDRLYNFY